MSAKPIASPIPEVWYPSLAVFMVSFGLLVTASFFIDLVKHRSCGFVVACLLYLIFYEATSSRKNRCLARELVTGAVASFFLGFGSLFLLLASGVYV